MTVVQTTEQPSEESFGRQSRIIAFVVAVAFFMQILDGTIVTTSLPQMARTFGIEPVSMSIGITVYLLTMAAFVPLAGWAGDRYGARRVFLASIAIFTMASLFCGLSGNLTEFIIARAVQGIGSALMTPVGRIIVLKNARKSDLVHAMSMITWPALTAPVIGPVLGSFITTYLSWHWNFLINIPIGIIGLGLVLRFVPDQREEKVARLDFIGFLQSAAGLTFLLAGLEFVVQGTTGLAASIALSPYSIFPPSRYRPSRCRRFRPERRAGSRSTPRRFSYHCCFRWASARRRSMPAPICCSISLAISA